MVTITIPKKLSDELDILISKGYYNDRSEFINEAIQLFLAQKPKIRHEVAIELYRQGKATISRAAEIAGIPFDHMKEILQDKGILRRGKRTGTRDSKRLPELI
jgi:Arc/MetJ-type ribon-helix-helix transcriptional regulator